MPASKTYVLRVAAGECVAGCGSRDLLTRANGKQGRMCRPCTEASNAYNKKAKADMEMDLAAVDNSGERCGINGCQLRRPCACAEGYGVLDLRGYMSTGNEQVYPERADGIDIIEMGKQLDRVAAKLSRGRVTK